MHFEYLNTGIDREQYKIKLHEYFTKFNINNGKYEKNLPDIYSILNKYGDMNSAIRNAKKLERLYDETDTPSNRKPSTMVYTIVEELLEYLDK